MFCNKCGKEIKNASGICHNCSATKNKAIQKNPFAHPEYTVPKTALGFWLGVFLGPIGLIIGICSYPAGTISRKTFVKGWLYMLIIPVILLVASFIIGVIVRLFTPNA